jgi:hypothetical protein
MAENMDYQLLSRLHYGQCVTELDEFANTLGNTFWYMSGMHIQKYMRKFSSEDLCLQT